jgi:hypothetical protein
MKKEPFYPERRQYIRLDSVFPVSFKISSLDSSHAPSDWIQGFTHNVSKGGILLEVNNLKPQVLELVKKQKYHIALSLRIQMPLTGPVINTQAKIAWSGENPQSPDRYLIGLNYEQIDPAQLRRILRYARTKKLFLPAVLTVIIILGIGFAVNGYISLQLIKGNRALVENLIKILQESNVAKQKIKEIDRDKDQLQLKISALQIHMQTVEEEKANLAKEVKEKEQAVHLEEEKAKGEAAKAKDRIKELNVMIDGLIKDKAVFQEQMITLQHKESAVTEELLRLDEKKAVLEKANFDKMYRWLTVHQNPRTGLVISFEGDNEIKNWAFIYDQSLVAQTYTNFSDFERAKKILDFFNKKAKRESGLFFNAYYADDATPAEYALHSGPNIWVGIAIMHYIQKTKDFKYLRLAEDLAQGIINLQSQDKDGGIRGGPNVEWFATEHNLDGYAFFNMLYAVTNKPVYRQASEKVLSWLILHVYDRPDIPVKRGKGDSTIATDTYAWSIAAIGPEKLNELGMNPDKIVEFAENNCAVEVDYLRPDGKILKIKGFDFAPQKHVSRGGVVSSEWSAQMVMSFRLMADYYKNKKMDAKAKEYEEKADEYLAQLCNMIISSPSPSGQGEGCLPYASCDFVDTGHGWITPRGKVTGSLAGTAYTLFAYYRYNPLQLTE